jgi:hypothetical protein
MDAAVGGIGVDWVMKSRSQAIMHLLSSVWREEVADD